jgi:hypothetical protein
MVLLGVYVLIRKHSLQLLAVLLIWASVSAVSLGFLAKHLVPQITSFLLLFAAIGVEFACSQEIAKRELAALLIVGLLFGIYGWLDSKLALLVGAIMLLAAISFGTGWGRWIEDSRASSAGKLLIFLSAGIILHGPFPFPGYPDLGKTAEEEAIHFLQAEMTEGDRILSTYPLAGLAAKLFPIEYDQSPSEFRLNKVFMNGLSRTRFASCTEISE